MQSSVFKQSFYCGLLLSLICIGLVIAQQFSILFYVSQLIAGFVYAIVLCQFHKNRFVVKQPLFILFAGFLFILVVQVACGYTPIGSGKAYIYMPAASILGAVSLFTLYLLLINKQLNVRKGLGYAVVTGLIGAIPLLAGHYVKFDSNGVVSYCCTMLVFVCWQSLFGLTITLSKQ